MYISFAFLSCDEYTRGTRTLEEKSLERKSLKCSRKFNISHCWHCSACSREWNEGNFLCIVKHDDNDDEEQLYRITIRFSSRLMLLLLSMWYMRSLRFLMSTFMTSREACRDSIHIHSIYGASTSIRSFSRPKSWIFHLISCSLFSLSFSRSFPCSCV